MTAETYGQVLYESLSETRPEDHDILLDNFVKILVQNGDTDLLPHIEEEFNRRQNLASGIKQVEVTTAREHPEILSLVNQYVGKNVEIKQKIDKGIVGGVIVRIDDALIDGSIKNSLQELKKTMKE